MMFTIVHKFTRIYPVCSTYELTKQFVQICVKNCTTDLKKNNLYKSLDRTPLNFSILGTSLLKLVRTFYLWWSGNFSRTFDETRLNNFTGKINSQFSSLFLSLDKISSFLVCYTLYLASQCHTVGQIHQICKETSKIWLNSSFVFILFVYTRQLFCTVAVSRIKCATETNNFIFFCYTKILT